MGVAVVGGAMRRPARVADAVAAGGGLVAQEFGEIGDAAGAFAQMQVRPGQGGEPGAVVAAIFQAAQALDEDGFRFSLSDIADDAAHAYSSLSPRVRIQLYDSSLEQNNADLSVGKMRSWGKRNPLSFRQTT